MSYIQIIDKNKSLHQRDDIYLLHLKGEENKNLSDLYDTVGNQLKVPPYFTRNMDSLTELLSDLSWMRESKMDIVITNYDKFLEEEVEDIRFEFLYILNDVVYEWSELGDKQIRILIEDDEKLRVDLIECGLD